MRETLWLSSRYSLAALATAIAVSVIPVAITVAVGQEMVQEGRGRSSGFVADGRTQPPVPYLNDRGIPGRLLALNLERAAG
ncbi:MAG: hypothetical protein HY784_10885 [Chloroflexi bacterium]|nr:hypothetical protein [Chloroflexota bacterium]